MLDFLLISTRSTKRGVIEVYPKFIVKKSNDLMIRGGDFYAIWVEELGLWSMEEEDVIILVDKTIDKYIEENRHKFDSNVKPQYMWDSESGMIDSFHKYCQKQMRDHFHMLDEKLVFANSKVNKRDYASKRLPYALEEGPIDAYERLISVLYTEEERHKIEWAIGSIVCGDSKKIQKFMVLYGAAGTGKSTILNIIQAIFDGYYSVFDAKALGSSSNSFALESFKSNPLVAIQHDGDLSKIEDNTRLNSLVSHELMTVNEKFKSTYANQFKCFLFMGTNKPVKITDAKSGLIRRLIDVSPSGNKIESKEYKTLIKQVEFEIGAIANHCMDVYKSNPGFYDDYIPIAMLGASNDFYNFVIDSYYIFKKEDGVSLKAAWEMYKTYCDEAKVAYPFSQRTFKEELRNYFREYKDRHRTNDDVRLRNYYCGFRTEKFEDFKAPEDDVEDEPVTWLDFKKQKSILDKSLSKCLAQYATVKETPTKAWDKVTTLLSDINTSELHYVKCPENHIVIDFDIKDETGKKCLAMNIEEASKWPPTYAELSKSGEGIHLHYIYKGDVSKLSIIYADHIEIKTFMGKSSLRRRLTKCNDLKIASISSGLPLKGEKMVSGETIKSEIGLRNMIIRNINKEFHAGTKPSIDFIKTILDDAYKSGMKYNVSDMRNSVLTFALHSSNQKDYCVREVSKMKFQSEEANESIDKQPEVKQGSVFDDLVFFDLEVFPNLVLINWKLRGKGNAVVRMINPKPADIEQLMKYKLVGFNCRRYDNHILYAALMGYTNEQLYKLSKKIIDKNNDERVLFGEAYNISYTDVYDFASASNKKSLKKFEIELDLHHQELGLDWDKPVPEHLWGKVAEYCDNDVISTEAVFEHLKGDWVARQILADIAKLSVNDTTNTLTKRFIFGNNRNPQDQFNYRNLADPHPTKPYFPGYKFEMGKSTYRDEEIGEGGYVYAEVGMYGNVALLDVASMHPTSIEQEELLGPVYTKVYSEIKQARVAIKHKDYDAAKKMLGGVLAKYLDNPDDAKALSNALKTALNSAYGLTCARFANEFKDKRNIDNIVAKRGALFMVDLKHAVQEQGFVVAHIKTDSIKIPDATPEIIKFVMDFGAKYGYEFEHEATYDKMCLVNDSVYIAKYATAEKCVNLYGYAPGENKEHPGQWTATGTQFAVPYVFKTLFTKEDITFKDLCEVKSVTSALYLDMNENIVPFNKDSNEDHDYHFVGRVGNFCPIKPGKGGGKLMRLAKDKQGNEVYYSATGASDYRWLEAELVKELNKEEDIDRNYYKNLTDKAVQTLIAYGDYEWFVSDDEYISPPFDSGRVVGRNTDVLPWGEVA